MSKCTPPHVVSDAFVVNALKLMHIASIYCCRQMPFKTLIETHELSTKEQRYRSQLKYVIETSTNSNSKTESWLKSMFVHMCLLDVCARLHLYECSLNAMHVEKRIPLHCVAKLVFFRLFGSISGVRLLLKKKNWNNNLQNSFNHENNFCVGDLESWGQASKQTQEAQIQTETYFINIFLTKICENSDISANNSFLLLPTNFVFVGKFLHASEIGFLWQCSRMYQSLEYLQFDDSVDFEAVISQVSHSVIQLHLQSLCS